MKRGIILVLTILLNIEIANAQSLNLFGADVSILTLLPIGLIFLVLLFFLGLFIKDTLTLKKKEVKREKEEIRKEEKPKEEKEPEKKNQKEILKVFFTKIKDFESKISSLTPKESLLQLDAIAKDFFKEKYSINQEFSLSELDNLVNITKEEKRICNEVEVLKFSGEEEAKTEKVKRLTVSLSELIKELYYKTRDKKEISRHLMIFVKISDFFIKHLKKEEQTEIKQETKEEVKLAQKEIPLTPIPKEEKEKKIFEIHPPKFFYYTKRLKILRELNDGIRIAKDNSEEAKKIYGKSLIEYYRLPVTEEEKITSKLTELYSKIKDDEIHKKQKISEKTKEIIKIKKEGHKRDREAKKILDSVERWITEISIKEEIKNEYRSVILGIRRKITNTGLSIHNFEKRETKTISDSITSMGSSIKLSIHNGFKGISNFFGRTISSIGRFERKEVEKTAEYIKNIEGSIKNFENKEITNLSKIIHETNLELKNSKERIVGSIWNNTHKLNLSIKNFELEEQKKVHNLIKKLENIKNIKEKIEKKKLNMPVPEKKEVIRETQNVSLIKTKIPQLNLKGFKIPEIKLQDKENIREGPTTQERWYKGILNIKGFDLPRVGAQRVKHPTEREVFLFKHKVELPKENITTNRRPAEIKKESISKLSKEEEKIMQKIDKLEEQKVTRTEIENLKIRYRNYNTKTPIFSREKSKIEREKINKLEREREELRNKLSSLY